MISTACLWRIAARSLYGLVSFLCNRKKGLTPDQALQYLLDARANLTVADPEHLSDHDGKKFGRRRGATVLEAYIAAARSAKHPRPILQANFLGAPNSVRNLCSFSETLLLSVSDGCTLGNESLDCLITLFRCPSSVGMVYSRHEGHHPGLFRVLSPAVSFSTTCSIFFYKFDLVFISTVVSFSIFVSAIVQYFVSICQYMLVR
jgi:hypothetical protein